jgi:oligopeptide transport system substrate-binding protein
MDENSGRMIRNPDYFGDFPGNLDAIEWRTETEDVVRRQLYAESAVDISNEDNLEYHNAKLPQDEFFEVPTLVMRGLCLLPTRPPLDDLRIRQALAFSLDRNAWVNSWINRSIIPAYGGMVPPGISGHTPDLALPYDPLRAAALLAEAGYPNGRGLPPLELFYYPYQHTGNDFLYSWQDLGIQVELHALEMGDSTKRDVDRAHLLDFGWKCDFPDPHDFLGTPLYLSALQACGWVDEHYLELIQNAAHTLDRAKRMNLYRQADRWLVAEKVLFIPVLYGLVSPYGYVKPWVKGLRAKHFGEVDYRRLRLERE